MVRLRLMLGYFPTVWPSTGPVNCPDHQIYSIDYKEIHFVKGNVYALIGNPDHPYGTSTDHGYYFIHDDLFDIILETDQHPDIIVKVVHKEP